jgi:hypothetical protein
MNKIYWHELPNEKQKKIFDRAEKLGKNWGWFQKRFKQPDWCDYPGALEGELGCWSLLSMKTAITREFCKNCDCYLLESEE